MTRGAGLARTSFRVVLDGESRGALDLACVTGERLPVDLRVGEALQLALELDRSVIAVEGKVCARTGSTLRVSIGGELSEQPRRRRYTRVRVNQPTVVRVERDDGRTVTVPGRLIDLSLGGCSLRLDVLVPKDAAVEVEAEIPLTVTLTGSVIRARGGAASAGTIGVRFKDLPNDTQAKLQQFLLERPRYRV